jgi:hypothetical protein
MYLSEVIDGPSVSPVIVRGLCDVWSKINSATFVTDEQNVFSLCSAEGPVVALRIHCVFYLRIAISDCLLIGFIRATETLRKN